MCVQAGTFNMHISKNSTRWNTRCKSDWSQWEIAMCETEFEYPGYSQAGARNQNVIAE